MKKILKYFITIMFTFLIICSIIPCTANAATLSTENMTTCEYLEDGSILITTITLSNSTRSSNTITAQKNQYYCDSNGNKLWCVTIIGTFTYTGSSSECTKASVNTAVYNSNWKISNSNASRSGNIATATATAKKFYNSTVIDTKSLTVSLKCDKNGNLS